MGPSGQRGGFLLGALLGALMLLSAPAAGSGTVAPPPGAVCSNPVSAVPGCQPPAYIGDGNTEGECSGVSGHPAFVDDSHSDPYHRLVRVKLDAPGDVPAPVKGTNVDVLLPRDYATSSRRYPVLYLFGGLATNQDTWLTASDLVPFTNKFVGDQAAIIVTVAETDSGLDLDWRSGRWLWESLEIKRLIPYIDTHFRTLADRAHRAVAGDSGGGFTAMHLAARHPDMFVAAASFSGFLDVTLASPAGEAGLFPLEREEDLCGGGRTNDAGLVGDPLTDDVWWHNVNPVDLADNLHGLTLFVSSGNGLPCGTADVAAQEPFENVVFPMSLAFSAALRRARVAHTDDYYGCGTHRFAYWQNELHKFWPLMLRAFGRRPPSSFDYRTADSPQHSLGILATSVYGWTFMPDPRRAPEFLDARDVSARGLALVGSGDTTVTTASLFPPSSTIRIAGAADGSTTAVADASGRITFSVDLGSPHRLQQYTPAERLAEQAPGYFRYRKITFTVAATVRHRVDVRSRAA
jgi:S-formylglutathione hydrolase FrmB